MSRAFVHRAASLLGVNAIARSLLARRLLVLCYHGVSAQVPDVPDPDGLHVPARLFEDQVELIVRHYRPVSLGQVRAHLEGRAELPRSAVLLTFDDGYRNVARHALPFLRRLGVPSVVFPVAGAVESGAWLWTSEVEWRRSATPDFGTLRKWLKALPVSERRSWLAREFPEREPRPLCDYSLAGWNELAEALASGLVAIGSHGLSHEPLTTCDGRELGEELGRSRRLISERLNVEVDAVAYPNGDWSSSVVAVARDVGYRLGFTTAARHVRENDDALLLPRILVGRADAPEVLASRLAGWREWMRPG